MKAARDPVGRGNDAAILKAASEAAIVVCAWGNHGTHRERAAKVVEFLKMNSVELSCLRINKTTGQPAHPLYLPGTLNPVKIGVRHSWHYLSEGSLSQDLKARQGPWQQ